MQNEITHIHTTREKKREMPHFLNSIFHEFLILPVLSCSRYSGHARSSSLVCHALSSLSHCASHLLSLFSQLDSFPGAVCPFPFLSCCLLYREHQHSVRKRAFTLLLTVLSITRRSMLFPPRRSWTATLRTGWASSYSNFITRGQNQKGSVYTGALPVSSYCCSIYNNKELEPDLMPVRRQMGNENEEERVSEEEREQQDHELLKQKGELGSEGEGTLPKHTLLK